MLAPCGTVSAYKRHSRKGEIPCDACRAANRERSRQQYQKSLPPDYKKREPAPCGTSGALARHRRRGEKPCETCRFAEVARVREWAARNPTKVREYQRRFRSKDGYKEMERERYQARRLADPERERVRSRERKRREGPDGRRNAWLKCSYGISLEELKQLLDLQGRKCAIGIACGGATLTLEDVNTDHCHRVSKADLKSGRAVRGLSCMRCNHLLGFLGDSLEGVQAFHLKLDALERYLTVTFQETQRRLTSMRSK